MKKITGPEQLIYLFSKLPGLGTRSARRIVLHLLQDKEFRYADELGYKAVKHQAFVGAGYFDTIQNIVTAGKTSTAALSGSTEEEQFHA